MTTQNEMKAVQVSELSGAALDWAVAMAEEKRPHLSKDNKVFVVSSYGPEYNATFSPSKRWHEAGPIIEREEMAIIPACYGWIAEIYEDGPSEDDVLSHQTGDTPLVAAMRCYVAAHFGNTVEVPAVLLEGEA